MRTQNQTPQLLNGVIVVGAGALSLKVSMETTAPLTLTYVMPATSELVQPYFAWANGLQEPFASPAMCFVFLGYAIPLIGIAFSPLFSTIYWLYRCSKS